MEASLGSGIDLARRSRGESQARKRAGVVEKYSVARRPRRRRRIHPTSRSACCLGEPGPRELAKIQRCSTRQYLLGGACISVNCFGKQALELGHRHRFSSLCHWSRNASKVPIILQEAADSDYH